MRRAESPVAQGAMGSRGSRGSSYRPGAARTWSPRKEAASRGAVVKVGSSKSDAGLEKEWNGAGGELRSGQAMPKDGDGGNECGQRPKGMAALRRSRQEKGT